jgi:hypothetical protein
MMELVRYVPIKLKTKPNAKMQNKAYLVTLKFSEFVLNESKNSEADPHPEYNGSKFKTVSCTFLMLGY